MATPTITPRPAPAPEVAAVRVPEGGLRQDLRAVKVVWQRDLIRFYRDRTRMFASFTQPVLFLFVLGTGLSAAIAGGGRGVNLRTFMFPGVLSMTVLFTASFSAGSIVWDREFGFLREMLVAPVRRGAIVLGKCLGGATVATLQGVVILCLAGLAGVPYSPALLATLVAELVLLAFALTALGVMLAARMRSIQSFMALMQMFMMPVFFLSGALFPLSNLPAWLRLLTRVDPLTYGVDPMRRAVFAHLPAGLLPGRLATSGVTWWGWRVPTSLELAMVALLGLGMLAVAIVEFRRAE